MKRVLIFPGQGSQTVGMAKEFYDNFDIAKQVFEEVNNSLNKDLSKIMFDGPIDLLTDTENAQPAIMTASIAILEVLKKESMLSIDKICDFVAGHSLGEYTALCACGAISLKDTAKLLQVRGKAFADASKKSSGTMLALIGASIEQATEVINIARINDEVLQIANDNTVGQIVLSGNEKSIDKAIEVAVEMKIKKALKLVVSGAFHSKLMSSAVESMEEILNIIEINYPKVNIFANYTANIENVSDIRKNLINQITGTVRWRETMLNLEQKGIEEFIEVGNGKVLSVMVPRTCPNAVSKSVNSIESMVDFINNL